MNIYEIDGMGKFEVGGKDVKTFYKDFCGGDLLRVEVGCKDNDRVYLALDVKGSGVVRQNNIHNRPGYKDENILPLRTAFLVSSKHELDKFIEALEFARDVLRQGRDKEIPF